MKRETELLAAGVRAGKAARRRRDRLLFVAAVFALLGAVVAGVVWNLARAWGS